jgi:hypothetical protein
MRRRALTWTHPLLGALVAAVATVLSPADARADSCAVRYHEKLQQVREGRGALLGPAQRTLRTTDPEMPGNWIYATALFPRKGKTAPKPERICVEEVSKAGRARCIRWEDKPQETPLTIATLPTDDEMVVFKFLDDVVRAKGAPPEFGSNGRYNWLVARIIGELRGYIAQPANEGLCAGAADLLDFYANELKTMRRRVEEVQEIDENTRDYAQRRIEQAEVFLRDMANGQIPAGAAPAGTHVASAAPMTPMPRQISPVSAALPRYMDLLERVAKLVLSNEQVAGIAAKGSLIGALREARKSLDTDTAREAAPEIREGVLVALRTLEAGIYAEALQARYKAIDDAVHGTITDIRQAHASACTCEK